MKRLNGVVFGFIVVIAAVVVVVAAAVAAVVSVEHGQQICPTATGLGLYLAISGDNVFDI